MQLEQSPSETAYVMFNNVQRVADVERFKLLVSARLVCSLFPDT
jgi:uncharacterized protein YecE (DUF72 family)